MTSRKAWGHRAASTACTVLRWGSRLDAGPRNALGACAAAAFLGLLWPWSPAAPRAVTAPLSRVFAHSPRRSGHMLTAGHALSRRKPPQAALLVAAAEQAALAAAAPVSQFPALPRKRLDRLVSPVVAADRAPTIFTYVVRAGDTLTSIAARFATDVLSLEKINGFSPNSLLEVGQKVTVLRGVGWLYTVAPGDTISSIAEDVGVSTDALEAANHLVGDNPLVQVGQKLIVPKEPILAPPTPPAPVVQAASDVPTGVQPAASTPAATAPAAPQQVAAPSGGATLIWPVHGIITSPFGWRPNPWGGPGMSFHHGLDIGVPTGTPVAAACSGKVSISSWDGGYGYAVEIVCDNGITTLYAHNSQLVATLGEQVSQGQLISYSGMTGNATGPHVHFGVMVGGVWVNPIDYLPPA